MVMKRLLLSVLAASAAATSLWPVPSLRAAPSHAQGAPSITRVTLDGVVDPLAASFIEDVIEGSDVGMVLLTIDTPGGLDSSMRKIVQAILNSRRPVICYVSPQGARAASAGTFILLSCPIAAMAPGTNVGAAHPVGVSGAVAARKVTNDAAGFIRSIAQRRGRNADWAEDAVRESVSVSATEALDLDVIDIVASSDEELLADLDGKKVELADREVTLETSNATIENKQMGAGARLLHMLFDPNLAFIFFYAGLVLVVVELLHPGVSVPGIAGVLLLVVALASFGMLPVQLVGLLLLTASVGFLLVELKAPGLGLATVGGLAALVIGGLFLFDRSVPGAGVDLGVILPVAIAIGLFFALVVQSALKARHLPPAQGFERVVGRRGHAVTDLSPVGVVHVGSEEWSAEADQPLEKGQPVLVTGMEGLRLRVTAASGPTVNDAAAEKEGTV